MWRYLQYFFKSTCPLFYLFLSIIYTWVEDKLELSPFSDPEWIIPIAVAKTRKRAGRKAKGWSCLQTHRAWRPESGGIGSVTGSRSCRAWFLVERRWILYRCWRRLFTTSSTWKPRYGFTKPWSTSPMMTLLLSSSTQTLFLLNIIIIINNNNLSVRLTKT